MIKRSSSSASAPSACRCRSRTGPPSGVVAESPLVLTDVVTDDGVVGHSIVFTYTTAALEPTAELVQNMERARHGRAAGAARGRAEARRGGSGCSARRASSAWRSRRSTWRSGTRWRGRTTSPLVRAARRRRPSPFAPTARSATTARRGSARGRGGVGDARLHRRQGEDRLPHRAEDVAVIRAIRKAVGDRRRDHGRLQPVPHPGRGGRQRLRVLDDEGLTWVEEPTLAHDFAGHARDRARGATRRSSAARTGGARWTCSTPSTRAASDFVMPDVMKIGGVTGWLRAAALAAGARASASPATSGRRSARSCCA